MEAPITDGAVKVDDFPPVENFTAVTPYKHNPRRRQCSGEADFSVVSDVLPSTFCL